MENRCRAFHKVGRFDDVGCVESQRHINDHLDRLGNKWPNHGYCDAVTSDGICGRALALGLCDRELSHD